MEDAVARDDTRSQYKPKRLKNRGLISNLRLGKAFKCTHFVAKYIPASDYYLGITTRKKIGKACVRNYIRRRLRHAFETASGEINFSKPQAFMLYCSPGLEKTEFLVLVANCRKLLENLSK